MNELEVVSSSFLRFGCGHKLFSPAYARSNRTKGTKILRCFPHCCPDHRPRCYCGCSLHVAVTYDRQITEGHTVIVCARFEATRPPFDTRRYRKGEILEIPADVLDPPSLSDFDDMPPQIWIHGKQESKTKHQHMSKNSVLYVMNNCRFPRWYYHYESGSRKFQREMTHQLQVYILEIHTQSKETISGRIVATLGSPEFTLVSYRRAPMHILAEKRSQTCLEDENDDENESDHFCSDEKKEIEEETIDSTLDINNFVLWTRKVPWMIQQLQQIGIIQFFIHQLFVDDISFCLDDVIAQIEKTWFYPAQTFSAPFTFAPFLLSNQYSENIDHKSHSIVNLVVKLGIIIVNSQELHAVYHNVFICQRESVVEAKTGQELFAEFISALYAIYSKVLLQIWTTSIPVLVDMILTVAFRDARFKDCRAQLHMMLEDRNNMLSQACMKYFLAKLREQTIQNTQWDRQMLQFMQEEKSCWVLDANSGIVRQTQTEFEMNVKLWCLMQWIREWGTIDIFMTDQYWRFETVTPESMMQNTKSGYVFFLDDDYHEFTAFPTKGPSLKTILPGFLWNEYCGRITHRNKRIEMECYGICDNLNNHDVLLVHLTVEIECLPSRQLLVRTGIATVKHTISCESIMAKSIPSRIAIYNDLLWHQNCIIEYNYLPRWTKSTS